MQKEYGKVKVKGHELSVAESESGLNILVTGGDSKSRASVYSEVADYLLTQMGMNHASKVRSNTTQLEITSSHSDAVVVGNDIRYPKDDAELARNIIAAAEMVESLFEASLKRGGKEGGRGGKR